MSFVVAFGNAFDGISLVGPFDTPGQANLYADGAEGDWTMVELTPPPQDWMEDGDE
jgi:hypothetical protein